MPLVSTAEIVAGARKEGRGVGAFNVIQLESAEAILAGAEDAGLPVILQISQNCVRYHGALAPIAAATLAAARASDIPAAVHLDHAESIPLVMEAVDLGLSSVMYDGSTLPYEQNLARTREVVTFCHDRGAFVEAELGRIGGKDGAHAPGVRTDPGEAASFVAGTGVDALAVAVGSSHAMVSRDAALDFDLIAELVGALPVPLVLHGSSGVSEAGLAKAVSSGMTKVNISTHLNKVFTGAVRERLDRDPELVDPRKYMAAGREAMADEVAALLRLLAGEA